MTFEVKLTIGLRPELQQLLWEFVGILTPPRNTVAPAAEEPPVVIEAAPAPKPRKPRRPLTEEEKERLRAQLVRGRAAIAAKRAAAAAAPAIEPVVAEETAAPPPAPDPAREPEPAPRVVSAPAVTRVDAPDGVLLASFAQVRQWAAERGIDFDGDLTLVNRKRKQHGLPPFGLIGRPRARAA